jgi:hypothetical protein
MMPLMLNGKIGCSCQFSHEGETQRSVELDPFTHQHPQTPTIYPDIAERWFSDLELPSFRDKSKESGEKDDGRSLDQIVERILEKQREIEQPEYKH